MPNAGYPVVTRTQVKYQGKPEYFAKELARIAAEGVRILGGCCGTTPAHIASLRAALDSLPAVEKAAPAVQVSTPEAPTVEKDDAFRSPRRKAQRSRPPEPPCRPKTA